MTGYLRILPALPLSMAYIDSISIAELVHNVKKKKKRKERLQNRSKEEFHSYCLHFLELVMMCEKSRYFTITSTKVQATVSLIEADENGKVFFDFLRYAQPSSWPFVSNQASLRATLKSAPDYSNLQPKHNLLLRHPSDCMSKLSLVLTYHFIHLSLT